MKNLDELFKQLKQWGTFGRLPDAEMAFLAGEKGIRIAIMTSEALIDDKNLNEFGDGFEILRTFAGKAYILEKPLIITPPPEPIAGSNDWTALRTLKSQTFSDIQ